MTSHELVQTSKHTDGKRAYIPLPGKSQESSPTQLWEPLIPSRIPHKLSLPKKWYPQNNPSHWTSIEPTYTYMAMDQYLYIPFLGGWTSIYQLFWCSPGVQGFDTLPYGFRAHSNLFQGSQRVCPFLAWLGQRIVANIAAGTTTRVSNPLVESLWSQWWHGQNTRILGWLHHVTSPKLQCVAQKGTCTKGEKIQMVWATDLPTVVCVFMCLCVVSKDLRKPEIITPCLSRYKPIDNMLTFENRDK